MDDRKLPELKKALDINFMSERFSGIFSGESPFSADGLKCEILKHKPGKHCVLRYTSNDGDFAVIGKVYRQNRGAARFENMLKLWQAVTDNPDVQSPLGMPRPLAYIPEAGMILQSIVSGRLMADIEDADELRRGMKLVGENLAKLHKQKLDINETRMMDVHLNKFCRPGPQALVSRFPELASPVDTLLQAFFEDERMIGAPLTTVHGDLNLKQIFIKEKSAAFIDFDGLCLAHPALDLGNFLIVIQTHFPENAAAYSRDFLDSYLTIETPRMLSGLPVYKSFAYFRRAMIHFRKHREEDCLEDIRRLIEKSLAMLEGEE